MLGAITGDIIGSVYEWNNIKTTEFELFSPRCFFTDDSVLTIALADAILNEKNYADVMREYYRHYPKWVMAECFINGRKIQMLRLITAGEMARLCELVLSVMRLTRSMMC